MQFDKGYISPYFITNPTEMKCELEDALILIYEKKISNVRDLLPLLEKVAQAGKPLLIIAEDVESEALAVLVVNKLRGVLQRLRRQGARLRRPPQGHARRHRRPHRRPVHQRGPRPQAGERRRSSSSARPRRSASRRRARRSSTARGKKDDIEKRIDQIRAQMDQTESEYDKEKFSERLAKLTGGVAIIRVGGGDRGRDEADQGPRRGRPARHPRRGGRGHRPRRRRGAAALHRGRSRSWPRSSKATRSSAPRSSPGRWRSRSARSPRTAASDGAVVADEVRTRGEKNAEHRLSTPTPASTWTCSRPASSTRPR